MRHSDPPREDPSIIALRIRQTEDLTKLDEDENLRIKRALVPRNRAFRRSSGGASDRGVTGRAAVRAASGRSGSAANAQAQSQRP